MTGPTIRRVRGVVAVVALAIGLVVAIAHAGEDDDRRRLIDEIDDLLDDAADDLDGLVTDSSSSDLDRALDRVSRVKDRAKELERIQGDDARARDIASRYPASADRFRDAATSLRQLKDSQRTLDEQPRACQDRMRELEAKIRAYVDRNDPAGIAEIPRLALEYGRPIVEALERATRRKDELARLRDHARAFSESDGRWSEVRAELHDSANEIFEYWTRKLDEAHQDCAELAKLERSAMVEAAMARLATSEQGRQAIYKELADELADTARLVTDVEADSDDGDVKAAARDGDDLTRLLDRLKAASGEDRKAREMSERWPAEVASMGRSLAALDDLKDFQFRADKAPERCRVEEDKIVRAADTLDRLDSLDGDVATIARASDDLDAVTQAAREGLLAALRNAAEAKRDVEALAKQASDWSPGPSELRAVDDELDESATDITKHYVQAEATAATVCAAPALGPAHPAAKKATTNTFGECTKQQWLPLRAPVTEYCKQRLRKCVARDSCDVLRSKTQIFEKCLAARIELRDRCFSKQRDSHDTEIETVDKGRLNCEKLTTENGC